MTPIINYFRSRPLAILNLLFLFLIIEYVILGKYSYIQIHDFAEDAFPRFIALWKNYFEYGFQTWSGDVATGTDRLSNVGYYDHFLSLLIAVFPAWLAYQLYIILTTYAGVWGFYKLSTDYFHYSKRLSALVAMLIPLVVSYSFTLELSSGVQFYPFAIYLIYWIDSRIQGLALKCAMLLGVIYLTSLTSYLFLGFVYFAPFMFLWFAVIGRIRASTMLLVAVAFLATAAIHHANFMALIQHAQESHRVEFSVGEPHAGRLVFLYTAVPALMAGAFMLKNKIISTRLATIFGIFLVLTIGDGVINYFWDALFGQTALATLKISRLAMFSTSLIAMLILDVANKINAKEKKVLTVSLALYLITLAVGLKLDHAHTWAAAGNYVANFESPPLKELRANDRSIYRVGVVEGATHPTMLSAYGFETADGFSPMYPLRYKHYWAKVIAPIMAVNKLVSWYFLDFGSRFYLFTGEPQGGGRFQTVKFRDFFNLNMLSLANVKYIVAHQPLIDERLQLVSEGPNSMSLGTFDKLMLRLRENFLGRESLFIYRNLNYVERIRAVNKIKYFASNEELLNYASMAPMEELQSTAFTLQEEKDRLSHYHFENSKASVSISRYSPSKIEFLVKSSGDVMVMLANSIDRRWKCTSQGKDLETFAVYETFFATVVGRGETSVTCEYRPQYSLL